MGATFFGLLKDQHWLKSGLNAPVRTTAFFWVRALFCLQMDPRPPQHAPLVRETYDIHRILAEFRFGRFTCQAWRDHRQHNDLPVLRAQLAAAERMLLDGAGNRAVAMALSDGAFFVLVPLVERLLITYIEFGGLLVEDGALRLKLSYDKRYIQGHGNIGFSVSFCDVHCPHNLAINSHTFAVVEADETAPDLAVIFAEMRLDEAIVELQQLHLETPDGHTFTFDIFFVGDWMSLMPLIGYERPSTTNGDHNICGWCLCIKEFLKGGWRSDPFYFHGITNQWTELLPNLPVSLCRYCPMHGCTRMLCGALQLVRAHAPHGARGRMDELMSTTRPRWTSNVALRCIEMKRFFSDRSNITDVATLYSTDLLCVPLPSGGVIHLPRCVAIHRLLDSIRVFYEFAYREQPHDNDINVLWSARHAYLGVFCALEWDLTPTAHYMTNHFIHFATNDGSAHHLLQEGTEHHHHDDRVDLATTVGRGIAWNTDGRTGFQQLLDQQEIRRLLVRMGYGPANMRPLFVSDGAATPQPFPLSPPHDGPHE